LELVIAFLTVRIGFICWCLTLSFFIQSALIALAGEGFDFFRLLITWYRFILASLSELIAQGWV